jgi:hypothetical protein
LRPISVRAADPCEVNTAITVDPGSVIDLTGRALQLDAAARREPWQRCARHFCNGWGRSPCRFPRASTQRVNVEATVGKTTKLSLKVSDPLGVRDSDSLQFKCVAAAP